MAARDNAYSRLVFWLKILLPLAALAILSTMFLVAHTIDPSRAIPFAKVDVTRLARDSQVTEPHYTGVTSNGSSLSLTAETVVPRALSPGQADATKPTGKLVAPNGSTAMLRAETGAIDTPGNRVAFDGDVHVDTSQDYHATAPHMQAKLDSSELLATGGVTVTAPFGHITAPEMRMTADPAAPGSYVVVFNGGVKLIYLPATKG